MRVAFVSMYTTDRRDTPALRRAERVAAGLSARGHEVVWLCARWWDGDADAFDRDGVTYRAVTDAASSGSFRSKLPFALRSVSPDVVQAVCAPPAHASTAATVCRLLRTPTLVDWWGADPDLGTAKGYRRAATKPDAVLVPSEAVRTDVRERGAAADDVHVVPESVDFDLVRSADAAGDADVVYARRLDANANVETLLLALAELRDREWRAAVVGDGPARAAAERTARDLRIDDRVTFRGDLPPAELVPLLKGAHAFAQTATDEPFATGLLWALACGCVGIVEYQAGSSAHELVEGFDRGRLVTSPGELADEIAACGGLERRTVDERFADFDHDAVLAEYERRYRETLE
ncbi:glycosyltransferase family 4 protein [Candidatus Halobonum tyrrellensis]|uniref:LPS biosynthesis protein n=1 Tax=Candidatus Halobonum tyrrellensis G22 TaxID=1324957 RepID=V4HM17_9EURY|nr:glycosyltransferase family 4 protein [Candidatus Halobonum tyrrellensis]ESP88969.1 LPS biosynthesis protein [Candidatus Halobonum tyrrellensis G22]